MCLDVAIHFLFSFFKRRDIKRKANLTGFGGQLVKVEGAQPTRLDETRTANKPGFLISFSMVNCIWFHQSCILF